MSIGRLFRGDELFMPRLQRHSDLIFEKSTDYCTFSGSWGYFGALDVQTAVHSPVLRDTSETLMCFPNAYERHCCSRGRQHSLAFNGFHVQDNLPRDYAHTC